MHPTHSVVESIAGSVRHHDAVLVRASSGLTRSPVWWRHRKGVTWLPDPSSGYKLSPQRCRRRMSCYNENKTRYMYLQNNNCWKSSFTALCSSISAPFMIQFINNKFFWYLVCTETGWWKVRIIFYLASPINYRSGGRKKKIKICLICGHKAKVTLLPCWICNIKITKYQKKTSFFVHE